MNNRMNTIINNNAQCVYNPSPAPNRKRILNFETFANADVDSAQYAQQDFLEIHKQSSLPNVPRSIRSGHYQVLANPNLSTQPVVNYQVPSSCNYQPSTVYYTNPWLQPQSKNKNLVQQQCYTSSPLKSNIHRPQYQDIREKQNPGKYNNQINNNNQHIQHIMSPFNERRLQKSKKINTPPMNELEYQFHCEQILKGFTPSGSHEIIDNKATIFYSPLLHKKNNLTDSERQFAKAKVFEKAEQVLGYKVSTVERQNIEEKTQYLQEVQTLKDNLVHRHKFHIDFENSERSLESPMILDTKDYSPFDTKNYSQFDDEKKDADESYLNASLYDDDNKQDEDEFEYLLSQIEDIHVENNKNHRFISIRNR